ncbi:hypothetical protein RvY_12135 [Ramazzottius varieornatus]|uniref:Receptor ligand binding region domain-containing protein n=1 Tax=Ramazzottius varieornatus TaxID=947166 RepID=A0A1D1VKH3_RAMVA|nr:hypothetical protein RvY_12135 [Ramazzottius varieornatus]
MLPNFVRSLMWASFITGVLSTCCATTVSPRLNVTVAIYGINTPVILGSLPYTLPGFLEGLKHIGSKYDFQINTTVLTGRHTKVVHDCSELSQYLYLVSQFYYSRSKDGSPFLLLHTGCNEIYDLAAMSREWNTLIFTSSGTVPATSLNSLDVFHNQISSSLVNVQQMVLVLQTLLKYFSWSTIAVVRDSDSLFSSLADTIVVFNEKAKDKLNIKTHTLLNVSTMEDERLLYRIKQHARIVLLLMNGGTVRSFLVKAHNASMTNGEYASTIGFASIPYWKRRRIENTKAKITYTR